MANRPRKYDPLYRADLHDADDHRYAIVTRNHNPDESLDFVAIKLHDNLITVSIDDVPAFLRAVMRAAAAHRS